MQHNQTQSVMDVITIESKAYHELMGKIEKILRYVEKEEKAKIEYENRLVSNDELAEILGISKPYPSAYAQYGQNQLQDDLWALLLRPA